MNIKVVNLRKVLKEGSRLLGVCQIIVNDVFVINDVKIIEGPSDKFIAMPSQKVGEKYIDLAHPINIETRNLMQEVVLSAFDEISNTLGEKDELEVTKIKLNYLPNATGPVAIVIFELNNCIACHRLLIVKELNEDGSSKFKFVLPYKEDEEGNRKSMYFFESREFLDKLFGAIFDEYKKGLNNNN